MCDFLHNFDKDNAKRCVYIHGPPGCGKTTFAKSTLKQLNYDIILYDSCDFRSKTVSECINVQNMSDKSIMSIFNKKQSKIAILIDEIEFMNGDRGGINTLIKLIRVKKTRRQQLEEITHVPIVCIGNNSQDKKIKELMKYSVVIEMHHPNASQIKTIIDTLVPAYSHVASHVHDMKKIEQLLFLHNRQFKGDIQCMFYKNIHEDTKQLTKRIMNSPIGFSDHFTINDTDRTIISLLWHENIIDLLQKMPRNTSIVLYTAMLKEMCFADYIDRITFQKQLWIFNEMSFLIKTMYTNHLFQRENNGYKVSDVRFTKVLTKYSTEYNNNGFIQKMCNELCMDKTNLFPYMLSLQKTHTDVQIARMFEHTDVTLLDIQRIYRYMNKCLT